MESQPIRKFVIYWLQRALDALKEESLQSIEGPLQTTFDGSVRIARHRLYANWRVRVDGGQTGFAAEDALLRRLGASSESWFLPFGFAFNTTRHYHYYLSFLIQAVELLPLNIDLSFDVTWRALECLWLHDLPLCSGKTRVQDVAPVVAAEISGRSEYAACLTKAFESIPVQTCEFIAGRLYNSWSPTVPKSDTKRILDRFGNPRTYPTITGLINAIAAKYSAPISSLTDRRKAAMLLRLAVLGRSVTVGATTFCLTVEERVCFFINALLYTYRNDRFHGSMQPPFKSTKATLQTYAHVHYCFLWANLLFLHAATLEGFQTRGHHKVASHAEQWFAGFQTFYGRHLAR